ncbi:DUF2637 domain-containing protein [Streptomyces rochei]|uniref:DUF2637 domain-containing protein n=1 Tax=Streptomyces rochei TaxID=1928 RepID=UPI002948E39C|nr:DUF2637 domain-containing protein [Streptomyces sp. UP1A-1]
MAAHAMSGATIWFNASSQGHIGTDPVEAASHSVMPILFVIGVEAARRLINPEGQAGGGNGHRPDPASPLDPLPHRQLDDAYDIVEYGNKTLAQLDAEVTAEAQRLMRERPDRDRQS